MFKRKSIKTIVFLLLLLAITTTQTEVQYLFSHGLADTHKQAHKYAKTYKIDEKTYHNERYIMDEAVSFNYPDAFLHKLPNIRQSSLAQDNEITHLALEIEKIRKEKRSDDIVLFGISRGASAALNCMALHDNSAVKALVLESPFDSMATIIDNKCKQLHLEWLSHDFGQRILEICFWKYKRDGIHPIDMVSAIDKDLPILIICSKKDPLVPWQSSIKLYEKLKKSGRDNVHLFVADHGKHAKIWTGEDGFKYQMAVHAFYKKYNLPYDPELALAGKKYLL